MNTSDSKYRKNKTNITKKSRLTKTASSTPRKASAALENIKIHSNIKHPKSLKLTSPY